MLLSTRTVLAAFASCLLVVGCAQDAADEPLAGEADLAEVPAASLAGSYRTDAGTIHGLVLSAGTPNTFIADVDTGIRCITTPCPSSEHVTGTYRVTKTTITLSSTTSSDYAKSALGTYRYTVVGETLSLTRGDNAAKDDAMKLDKIDSYCSLPSDCAVQGLLHPMCVGHWTCSDKRECGYACGVAL